MKYINKLLFIISIISCSDSKRATVTPREYLDEVLSVVEASSIKRDLVDFDEIRRNAYAKISDTDSIEKCYPIVRSILASLGDSHSFFMPKEQVEQWLTTSKISEVNEVITFKCETINTDIGYIQMKGFNSGDSISIQLYADSLQNQIKSIDSEIIKGWVLDLRGNTGGNCWPMLAGLGPLLGNGVCGYFIDNNQAKSSWFYQDGESGIDSLTITKVSIQDYKLFNELNPVAVLTGRRTASSGEVVTAAFKNKINAKSFGEKTGGYTTGNKGFQLSDGSKIFLASSIYADREENVFGDSIEPDEKCSFLKSSIGQTNDSLIIKAMNWIYEN